MNNKVTMSEGERMGILLSLTKDNVRLMKSLKSEPRQILKGSSARMARRLARDFGVVEYENDFNSWSLTTKGYEVMEER